MVVALLVAIQPCLPKLPAVPSRTTRKIANIDIHSFNLGKRFVAISCIIASAKAESVNTSGVMAMLGSVGIEPTQRNMLKKL